MILCIILIVITVINLLWIFVEFNNYDTPTYSVVVLIFVALFGWLIFGNAYSVSYEIKKTKLIEMSKSENFIIVTDFDKYIIFDKKTDFDNITDTTTFYYYNGINMYGGVSSRTIFYYKYTMDTLNMQKGVKL